MSHLSNMRKIEISVIPQHDQRYETVGDWYFTEDGVMHINVSDVGDWKKEMLVAVHELVEVILCKAHHVTQKQVDDFDFDYNARRAQGEEKFQGDPGDDKKSPYHNEHCFATAVERMLCAAFGIGWAEYEEKLKGALHVG